MPTAGQPHLARKVIHDERSENTADLAGTHSLGAADAVASPRAGQPSAATAGAIAGRDRPIGGADCPLSGPATGPDPDGVDLSARDRRSGALVERKPQPQRQSPRRCATATVMGSERQVAHRASPG